MTFIETRTVNDADGGQVHAWITPTGYIRIKPDALLYPDQAEQLGNHLLQLAAIVRTMNGQPTREFPKPPAKVRLW